GYVVNVSVNRENSFDSQELKSASSTPLSSVRKSNPIGDLAASEQLHAFLVMLTEKLMVLRDKEKKRTRRLRLMSRAVKKKPPLAFSLISLTSSTLSISTRSDTVMSVAMDTVYQCDMQGNIDTKKLVDVFLEVEKSSQRYGEDVILSSEMKRKESKHNARDDEDSKLRHMLADLRYDESADSQGSPRIHKGSLRDSIDRVGPSVGHGSSLPLVYEDPTSQSQSHSYVGWVGNESEKPKSTSIRAQIIASSMIRGHGFGYQGDVSSVDDGLGSEVSDRREIELEQKDRALMRDEATSEVDNMILKAKSERSTGSSHTQLRPDSRVSRESIGDGWDDESESDHSVQDILAQKSKSVSGLYMWGVRLGVLCRKYFVTDFSFNFSTILICAIISLGLVSFLTSSLSFLEWIISSFENENVAGFKKQCDSICWRLYQAAELDVDEDGESVRPDTDELIHECISNSNYGQWGFGAMATVPVNSPCVYYAYYSEPAFPPISTPMSSGTLGVYGDETWKFRQYHNVSSMSSYIRVLPPNPEEDMAESNGFDDVVETNVSTKSDSINNAVGVANTKFSLFRSNNLYINKSTARPQSVDSRMWTETYQSLNEVSESEGYEDEEEGDNGGDDPIISFEYLVNGKRAIFGKDSQKIVKPFRTEIPDPLMDLELAEDIVDIEDGFDVSVDNFGEIMTNDLVEMEFVLDAGPVTIETEGSLGPSPFFRSTKGILPFYPFGFMQVYSSNFATDKNRLVIYCYETAWEEMNCDKESCTPSEVTEKKNECYSLYSSSLYSYYKSQEQLYNTCPFFVFEDYSTTGSYEEQVSSMYSTVIDTQLNRADITTSSDWLFDLGELRQIMSDSFKDKPVAGIAFNRANISDVEALSEVDDSDLFDVPEYYPSNRLSSSVKYELHTLIPQLNGVYYAKYSQDLKYKSKGSQNSVFGDGFETVSIENKLTERESYRLGIDTRLFRYHYDPFFFTSLNDIVTRTNTAVLRSALQEKLRAQRENKVGYATDLDSYDLVDLPELTLFAEEADAESTARVFDYPLPSKLQPAEVSIEGYATTFAKRNLDRVSSLDLTGFVIALLMPIVPGVISLLVNHKIAKELGGGEAQLLRIHGTGFSEVWLSAFLLNMFFVFVISIIYAFPLAFSDLKILSIADSDGMSILGWFVIMFASTCAISSLLFLLVFIFKPSSVLLIGIILNVLMPLLGATIGLTTLDSIAFGLVPHFAISLVIFSLSDLGDLGLETIFDVYSLSELFSFKAPVDTFLYLTELLIHSAVYIVASWFVGQANFRKSQSCCSACSKETADIVENDATKIEQKTDVKQRKVTKSKDQTMKKSKKKTNSKRDANVPVLPPGILSASSVQYSSPA
ncbi:hypothetical protein ADUPG1_010582, partial [Aduncisulcus paluster]